MQTFLGIVASDLYHKLKGDFTHVAIVFPNRRAALFFNEYLLRLTDKPIWAPTYISIDELFSRCTTLQKADTIKLICELWKVYVKVTGSEEPLDDFYHWGELLLADFDDADKQLADTKTLFSNLSELKEIGDGYEFLEEGQKEALQTFFSHFANGNTTELKSRFVDLWNVLGPIYTQFKQELFKQDIAYTGMLQRQVIEDNKLEQLPFSTFVMVGFNVLNRVETILFSRLAEKGKAMFYWDYDKYYTDNKSHEAGEFIRRNLSHFPNQLPEEYFNSLRQPKQITYIRAATNNAQTRYLPQWIHTHITQPERETAVVLCDENLLPAVLHALPSDIRHTNITMGYPLSRTPVYGMILALLELYTAGYREQHDFYLFKQVEAVLSHPYIRKMTPQANELLLQLKKTNQFYPSPALLQQDQILAEVFKPIISVEQICIRLANILEKLATTFKVTAPDITDPFDQLYRESVFRAYTLINRFIGLSDEGVLIITPQTLTRLLDQVMVGTGIPFHGEPAIGLQVMGVLETRNLDFKHLILLSAGESSLPKNSNQASFIPYNLRKAFGLTTIDHRISVFAYYFYRMIQRAEKVTLVYNNTANGLQRGEPSRFLLQLLADYPYPIQQKQLELHQSPMPIPEIHIKKTTSVIRALINRFDTKINANNILSPSAINTYLDCRLKFYYRYVAGLKQPDEVMIDIDPAHLGTIFHQVAQWIYEELSERNPVIDKGRIEQLLSNSHYINQLVARAFKKHFFHVDEKVNPEYNGLQFISATVVQRYITRLLNIDLRQIPFTYVASEMSVYETRTLQIDNEQIQIKWGGYIDRIDCKDGIMRIIDYKTGGNPETVKSIESLFVPDEKRPNYALQTFIYASILNKQLKDEGKPTKVAPALFYIHRAAADDYSPFIHIKSGRETRVVDDFDKYDQDFRQLFYQLIDEIFDVEVPFTSTLINSKCDYCEFKKLCNK